MHRLDVADLAQAVALARGSEFCRCSRVSAPVLGLRVGCEEFDEAAGSVVVGREQGGYRELRPGPEFALLDSG
jgi:hypothetical protein